MVKMLPEFFGALQGGIAGSAILQDVFQIRVSLADNAADGALDIIRSVVSRGHDRDFQDGFDERFRPKIAGRQAHGRRWVLAQYTRAGEEPAHKAQHGAEDGWQK